MDTKHARREHCRATRSLQSYCYGDITPLVPGGALPRQTTDSNWMVLFGTSYCASGFDFVGIIDYDDEKLIRLIILVLTNPIHVLSSLFLDKTEHL